jgi:hypothetical protein
MNRQDDLPVGRPSDSLVLVGSATPKIVANAAAHGHGRADYAQAGYRHAPLIS